MNQEFFFQERRQLPPRITPTLVTPLSVLQTYVWKPRRDIAAKLNPTTATVTAAAVVVAAV